jgi:dTDP-4-dehydrorhamnose 3,5-epimerase
MFECKTTALAGCLEIQPRLMNDARGRFVKVFHQEAFREHGLETEFAEEYYSHSRRGVIRGMHFQLPPAEHVKLVYAVHGEVFDVVLDLRVGSPTYGRTASFRLSAEQGNCLYIPKGFAHGFCATSELATLVYKVSTVYAPQLDAGVLWNSLDIDWPAAEPIVSERDASFRPLAAFESPFVYE